MITVANFSAAIELQDNFSAILSGVINVIDNGINAIDRLHAAYDKPLSTNGLKDAQNALEQLGSTELKQVELSPVVNLDNASVDITPTINIDNARSAVEDALAPISAKNTLNVDTSNAVNAIESALEGADASKTISVNADIGNAVLTIDGAIESVDWEQNLSIDASSAVDAADKAQTAIDNIAGTKTVDVNADINRAENAIKQLNDKIEQQHTINVDGSNLKTIENDANMLANKLSSMSRQIGENTNAQRAFNSALDNGVKTASKLEGILSSAVGAYLAIMGGNAVKAFIDDCQAAYDVQLNAENQLLSVLNNTQKNADDVSKAFDKLTKKASDIQGKGIYGDEAMIAGAAEFATYMQDTEAIAMMMDTLSNYTMGMTGGAAVGKEQMVQYATNIGKIMTGSYDAMTKKGFEFTDAQQAIIEGTATQAQIVDTLGKEYAGASKELQAAAAISQVIDQSWAGIYESMSNTAGGKVIMMNNILGDIKETIGKEVYPYTLLLVDAFNKNWPTINKVVDGIIVGLQAFSLAIAAVVNVAMFCASIICDNWGLIAPVLGIVTAAFVLYNGALLVCNAYTAISNGLLAASNAIKAIHYASTIMSTQSTIAFTAAQMGLNAAILANPLVWFIGIIFACVAAVYLIIAAINYFADTSYSATGFVCAAFAEMGAYIYNIVIFLINGFLSFCEFLCNVFVDPLAAIQNLFTDIWNGILNTVGQAVQQILKLIAKIPGLGKAAEVNIGSYALERKEIEGGFKANKLEYKDLGKIGENAYKWGSELSIDNFATKANEHPQAIGNSKLAESIADNTGNTAKSTDKMAKALEIFDEDLKFFRDVAEQEVINKYTTASVNIKLENNNNISSNVDTDGMVSSIVEQLREAVDAGGEAVHE